MVKVSTKNKKKVVLPEIEDTDKEYIVELPAPLLTLLYYAVVFTLQNTQKFRKEIHDCDDCVAMISLLATQLSRVINEEDDFPTPTVIN